MVLDTKEFYGFLAARSTSLARHSDAIQTSSARHSRGTCRNRGAFGCTQHGGTPTGAVWHPNRSGVAPQPEPVAPQPEPVAPQPEWCGTPTGAVWHPNRSGVHPNPGPTLVKNAQTWACPRRLTETPCWNPPTLPTWVGPSCPAFCRALSRLEATCSTRSVRRNERTESIEVAGEMETDLSGGQTTLRTRVH